MSNLKYVLNKSFFYDIRYNNLVQIKTLNFNHLCKNLLFDIGNK